MDEIYRWAADRARAAGAEGAAERLASGGNASMDRRPICVAIMAAIDAVDLRRTAVVDHRNASRWLALAENEAQISRAHLAVSRIGEVAR